MKRDKNDPYYSEESKESTFIVILRAISVIVGTGGLLYLYAIL